MVDDLYVPVNDATEIERVLVGFPAVVDRTQFVAFVQGFPKRYLVQTPKVEIVKHFLLAQSLSGHRIITALAEEKGRWKLSVLTRDRSFLFAQISGTLSCFGMNIVTAEAFANAHEIVLDTFYFEDPAEKFQDTGERQIFQDLLEDIVSGTLELEPMLESLWPDIDSWQEKRLEVNFDNEALRSSTLMGLRCRDRFGLLYLISHFLSAQGYSIEMAYIRTEDHEADDEFYLRINGQKLEPQHIDELREAFAHFSVPHFA
jgi:[protein-PII] uridylyltransferase